MVPPSFISSASHLLLLLGGPTVVLGAILGWLGKRYLDSALQDQKARHDETLEDQKRHYAAALEADKSLYAAALEEDKANYAAALERQKSGSEKHIYIYKSQFELEFQAYQELWSKLATLTDGVAVLLNYARYTDDLPASLKKDRTAHAKAADAAFFEANHANNRLMPFIDFSIHKQISAHNRQCKEEIDTFFFAMGNPKVSTENVLYDPQKDYEETKEVLADIKRSYTDIGSAIRDRMASLLVLDE